MSWTEKKLSLPFMGADSRSRAQEETAGKDAGLNMVEPPVIRAAHLKKLKSNRKKWFVLHGATATTSAKLEYYDSERKWRSKAPPKRSIILEKCFNINRKQDTRDSRNKLVIALYTLDDCVSIVFETENELNDWLDQLLTLQQGKAGNIDGKKPVPNFEHMWTVNVKSFSPEENNFTRVNHLMGQQRLCVTSDSVMFFPVGSDHSVEFPHACIRCCAYNDRHFKLETGRNSPSGSGSLLIDCDDKDVTHHLHETMLKAMVNSSTKELYLKSSRNRSLSLSEAQRHHQNHPPKSIPRNVESRNRTISEPPDKPGQVTPEPGMKPTRPHSMRYGSYISTSPNMNPLSPISPVGSVTERLSSDGTGSSNSINDPLLLNGDHEPGNMNSYQPDVIPEESSGEISIEFNQKPDTCSTINQTLPRCQPHSKYYHQKQASLTDFTYDDYMDMGGPAKPSQQGPPLQKRSFDEGAYSSSPKPDNITSPTDSQPSSSYSSEYHIMSPKVPSQATPQISPTEGIYFDMDRLHISEPTTSTPLKSTSSITLVHSDSIDHQFLKNPEASSSSLARTPPVAIKNPATPSTVLTPPEGVKRRIPSGDGGYVIMSPGVAAQQEKAQSILEEPSSLAMLEESLGSGWRGSPRHTSPSFRRDKSRPTSKRNSSCLDESEAHWEPWRYDSETLDGPDDIYAPIYYPGRNSTSRPTPTPLSRVSPASSSSAVSGTPSSDSRFTDFHDKLEKISSYFKYDEDERVVSRPPHTGGRRSIHTPKYMDIPTSNTSSRSNISPFGRTPPSGVSGSPTVASRLEGWKDGLFRHRAGSVPTRPPIERRRHRTQSEGEKDASKNS